MIAEHRLGPSSSHYQFSTAPAQADGELLPRLARKELHSLLYGLQQPETNCALLAEAVERGIMAGRMPRDCPVAEFQKTHPSLEFHQPSLKCSINKAQAAFWASFLPSLTPSLLHPSFHLENYLSSVIVR